MQAEHDTKVALFIDQENRLWKDDLLDRYFFDFEADIIRKIPLCRFEQADVLTWSHIPNGDYTIKSGYSFLQADFQHQQPGPSDSGTIKPLWQAIWNLNVLSKIKNLVWRACHDALPSKTNLVKRKVLSDATCEICQAQQEDGSHALILCLKLTSPGMQVPL